MEEETIHFVNVADLHLGTLLTSQFHFLLTFLKLSL